MRTKIIQIADILSQAVFIVVKIALGDNKDKPAETEEKLINSTQKYEKLSDEEADNLINVYLESLDNISRFFGEWEERDDDDKYDEFLHYFYHLDNIIKNMEFNGMIVQSKDEDGTNVIDIPKLARGRDDN